mgnify:FL=1
MTLYRPIVAALGFVLSADRTRVLMVQRTRDGDTHAGKYNGLGGKLEPDEDIGTCLTRELREELGIEVTSARLRGTVNWPGFGKVGESWFGFVFVVDAYEGVVPERNDDGPLHWVEIDRVGELPLWEGDAHFLPLVFDDSVAMFHAVLPYDDDNRLVSASVVVERR